MAARTDAPLSHDNLFQSVLGMLDVDTEARQPALDIFESCDAAIRVGRL